MQNTNCSEDLVSFHERKWEWRARIQFIFFSDVSMSSETAHKSVYLPFSSINFCNINDKGDDKEPIDY